MSKENMTTKVAVYGSLRQGMGNHRILEGANYLGTTLSEENYSMYSLGGFPKVSLTVPVCPIVLEIYECDDNTMRRLDMLEGYRGEGQANFYDRSLIKTGLGDALIYHIEHKESNCPLVESGDWVQYRQATRG